MDSLAPRLADYPICTLEKLRFADTDRNGHLTNSVFAACWQNARMELLYDPPACRSHPTPSSSSPDWFWSSGRRCTGEVLSTSARASTGSGDVQ